MIKVYLIVIQLFGVLFANFFLGSDVSMKADMGTQINAGKEITISITLNKSNINGFSRFQMELPAGITASNANSANADFSFKDQKVRLVWLRLPEDETVTFTFTIQCDERLKGNFDLTGKFSYIDENERKNVDLQSQNIAIIPSPNIDPNMLVDIKDYGKMGYPQIGINSMDNIACIRQKPLWSEQTKDFTVTLFVNKETLKKFAKIEETIPAGYTAINVDSRDGIFTTKDNKIKFLWMNLPADAYFTVSYKLIPLKGKENNTTAIIDGAFSYIVEDKTQIVKIIEKDVSLANLTAAMVREILHGQTAIAAVTTPPVVAPPVTPKVSPTPVTPVAVVPEKVTPVAKIEEPKPEKVVAVVQSNTKPVVAKPNDETAELLDPKTGIYYRVQIAAGHRPINIKSYFRKYKLENQVVKEMHDGWIKYAIGTFSQYRDARDYRVHIWNTTTIADAFVSAYNNGNRITVQEALMVANQKWTK